MLASAWQAVLEKSHPVVVPRDLEKEKQMALDAQLNQR